MPEDRAAPGVPGADSLPPAFPSLRQAPPRAFRTALTLENTLKRLGVRRGDRLLLAVSGGADSTALVCLTALLRDSLSLSLHLAVCDHGLRPESRAEAEFVAALGKLLNLPSHCLPLRLDPAGPALEERARKARHGALARLREELGAAYILLGHHAGDLSEDILLRLLRGTGWPGLGGMPEKDDRRRVLRPLLDLSPALLREILAELGMPHCEDPSNADRRFARNRLRHELLPGLRAENPGLDRALGDLAKLARIDAAFFAETTDAVLEKCPVRREDGRITLFIPGDRLSGLPKALRLRLYLAAIRQLVREGAEGQARAATLFQLDEAFLQGRYPGTFQLPGGLSIALTREGLRLRADIRESGT